MSGYKLKSAGFALYGERWVEGLSKLLGVSTRSVRRWGNGSASIPAGVWVEVHRLMQLLEYEVKLTRLDVLEEIGDE
tara:strand:+ start:262 stop:492 length:231 start_codon:yes stop_codon:yes gene_type:complete